MNVIKTKIAGLLLIEPKVYGDARGYFFESFQQDRYQEIGIQGPFVQDNVSRSRQYVLRGLHHQKEQTQGKLVYVTRGSIFDVAVDIRQDSETFGQWFGAILDDQTHRQLYIPEGCAHGFCVLSDEVDFIYKCTNYYHPKSELSIRWDDPSIGIDWPIETPILSEKDQNGRLLNEIPKDELPLL
ncbi:MAG: dTDP-4-dehydrorhamnose 3,5-epimerase [Pseudomonadota bacterium]|nr:dTDP-4-dehydrorhamnose 3,5-epimerase [Gammaproteobacteria bacterium]MBU1629085.1 dTDP-4-dehydrorhamnose 3,5-epimerase [Gammaproteobacteria bacterium]MBU1926853.1 dTDP-4-dehydrorhamnose 3,5-epimerase [Gammaproteobacteria bacterium]MBU2546150.1 dTDP-4-dehydrorhamnose 3,5-epimerase [Gammaproteobacteria bacterium]